jgi:xylulokinase
MYLGIDLGTSEVKVLLLSDDHRIVVTAGEALAVQRPKPLWSEQDPADWWVATDRAMRRLRAAEPKAMAAVRALGLAGQMHGAVLLDAADAVLRPSFHRMAGRSGAECLALEAAVPELHAVTGNLAMPGFTAPKLLWVRAHEPAVFRRVSRVLLPKDWLRLTLTGDAVSDMSDASGTLWLDVGQRRWSDAVLAACGLDERQMPRLTEGSAPTGVLRPGIASEWGLGPGVVVAGGGGDNAASAVGMGAVHAGEGFVSLGTSGVVFVVTDAFRPAPAQAVHAFAHALPGVWHQMSVMLSAASGLAWVTRLTGRADEAALVAEAARLTTTQREQAPLFLPYLSGERTPHNNPNASGVFMGLRSAHGPADLVWAVIEGVTFGLMDGMAAMQGDNAAEGALALVGGGARSELWAQMIASGLGRELKRPDGALAAGALGAARLGWLAHGGRLDQVCPQQAAIRTFVPEPQESARLQGRYARFRALYPALAAQFAG